MMMSLMKQIIISIVICLWISKGNGLQCYKCRTNSLYDRSCDDYPYENAIREVCPIHEPHVCTVYKYDVMVHGMYQFTSTVRGCQPLSSVQDCRYVSRMAQRIVRPGLVRDGLCYSCDYDLCNSSSNIMISFCTVFILSVFKILI